jgi:hypothetical protein
MHKLTLTYFDFPGGRGEASRLALHIAGVDWTDNRVLAPSPKASSSTTMTVRPPRANSNAADNPE